MGDRPAIESSAPLAAMRLFEVLLILFAMFGHLALWVYLYNRLHALPLPCWLINTLEKGIYLLVLAGLAGGGWLIVTGQAILPQDRTTAALASFGYFIPCCVIAVVATRAKLRRDPHDELDKRLVSGPSRVVDIADRIGQPLAYGIKTRVLTSLPGNETFQLEVNEKSFSLPNLPSTLDGITVAHLSDLHFTGNIGQAFYDAVIDEVLSLEADLIVVAGDIIDKARCLDWIPQTLGRLAAPHGVYAVLGNHDKRICEVSRVRRMLTECGIVDLGGRCQQLAICGETILLAGNEMPWFPPAPVVPPKSESDEAPFRLLVSHSPDQVGWARQHGFDLMLAGHTHGGQIRFPWIGPVIAPSLYGVRYASGVFYEAPTLMHVSRGVCGLHPIRWNCRPEVSRLVLRRHPIN